MGVGAELDALLFHDGDAAVDDPLFDLVVGDAVPEEASDLSSFSKTTAVCPAQLSCCAAASPAGPLPTMATFLPVRFSGGVGLGTTHPSSKALLMMESSSLLW